MQEVLGNMGGMWYCSKITGGVTVSIQTGSDLRQAEGPDWLASLKSRSTKIKANNELALAA